jgi:hypothetical protein
MSKLIPMACLALPDSGDTQSAFARSGERASIAIPVFPSTHLVQPGVRHAIKL